MFSSGYLDYGLKIVDVSKVESVEPLVYKEGYEPFYNPHCLSSESYGSKPPPDYEGEPEDCEELIEWSEDDWKQCLKDEADVFIEAYQLEED